MSKNIFAALIAFAMSSSAFAGILNATVAGGEIAHVKTIKEGTVQIAGQQIPVSYIGGGLRIKILFKVYVAELLSSDASKFVRSLNGTQALDSLNASRTTVLRLTFLRDVDADTLQSAFSDAYKANVGGDINADTSTKAFFNAVLAMQQVRSGSTLVIALQKNADKTETLVFEDGNGKVTSINGSEGFSRKILSFWLGNTEDGHMEDLKKSLITGQ